MDKEKDPLKAAAENVMEEETEQFVTFVIGDERYGVDILKVRDIIDMTEITTVPGSQHFLKGVINLRGAIVPVVDMRLKFAMTERLYDSFTVIVVVEVKGKLIGMIVDAVADVVEIALSGLHGSATFKTNLRDDFISGIGRHNDQLIIILDVDRILLGEGRGDASGESRRARREVM